MRRCRASSRQTVEVVHAGDIAGGSGSAPESAAHGFLTSDRLSLTSVPQPSSLREFHRRLLRSRGYDDVAFDAISVLYEPARTTDDAARHVGYGAAMAAIRSGDAAAVARLLRDGALDACAQNVYGTTVLHHACRAGCVPIVSLLLANGAPARCSDDSGKTPLHDVAWGGGAAPRAHADSPAEPARGDAAAYFAIAELLLDADESLLRAADRLRSTPLDYVGDEQAAAWRAFLANHADRWWAHRGDGGPPV